MKSGGNVLAMQGGDAYLCIRVARHGWCSAYSNAEHCE